MTEAVARLVDAVQTNCHIADARHAGELTLCIYLLQMRELYRWEHGLPFRAALERPKVGAWIAEREALWSQLETRPFVPVPCGPDSASLDPFDVTSINEQLRPAGLIYGAGLGETDRSLFFLAESHARTLRDGVAVHVAGRELARCLIAPPAVLGSAGPEATIVVRRESLARWCWEKFEAFSLRASPGGAFQAVVSSYGLDQDFEAALPRWLEEQCEVSVLHELGEYRAGQWLGPQWGALRLALPSRRIDLYARAVRDHLADLLVTLPTLLERNAAASIHAWFANYDGVRELLYPGLVEGYGRWRGGDGGLALGRACQRGLKHFEGLARAVLALHSRLGDAAAQAIELQLTSPTAVCPQ